MSEMRCPMCGKLNPPGRDVCQFCQARLTPLSVSPEEAEGAAVGSDDAALPAPGGGPLDDWLSSLRGEDEPLSLGGEKEDSQSFEMPFDELPDWLSKEHAAGESESGESAQAESVPDWLASLREDSGDEGEPQPEEPDTAPPPEEDLLPPAQPADKEFTPDWLLQDAGQEPFSESGEGGLDEVGEGADEPNWLQRIRQRQETEYSAPEGVDTGEAASTEAEQSAEAVEPPAPVEGTPPTEKPPAALEPAQPPDESAEEPAITQTAEEQAPEWLAGLAGGKAFAADAADTARVDADAEGLPDWLADLDKSSSLDRDEIVPFGEEEPGLTFDWLQEQVRLEQGLPPEDEPAPEEAAAALESAKVVPFAGDLSDFLEEEFADAPEAEQSVEPPQDLTPAELPTWLEAMRPVEATALELLDEESLEAQIESSGPLAGLRGVLPAEPDIARVKKPPTYAIRLQVTDSQQANAALLEDLVISEADPKSLPQKPVISSHGIYRLIIFAVLVITVLWMVFTRSQSVPLPALPQEVFDTTALINALPQNPKILLAVDYEPGFSGEMQAASSVILDQMMLKGSYFTLVSTTANGPALAEALIQRVASQSGHQYQGIDQYANLGYIPGGAAGLASYARSPRKITPFALDPEATYIWGREPLRSVDTLSDFNLVAVVTNDADKARAWVEQVQPSLGSTPLVMVLSAQAEPLVRPYYQANPKQVQGMVAGLAGAAAYENAHQDLLAGAGPARQYWDAFSYVLLVAAAMIVLGSVVNLVIGVVAARKQSEGEK